MRHTTFLLFWLLVCPGFSLAASKPNVLLIYSDDHGWADLGIQGVDRDIRTPQLDRLASDGVRFARGYVSAPQCVPSRAGVITGRYQQRFGVETNNDGPLPLAEVSLAERLKSAGYLTGQVGKWHLDMTAKGAPREARLISDHMPHGQGFDEYWRGEMRQFYASHSLSGEPFSDAPRLVPDSRFRITVQTEAALAFLDRRRAEPDRPWFLYLAWFAPHVPLESAEPWFSRTPAHLPLERRQALAMIAAMDEGLGRIREKIRNLGDEQQTLIFFIGDNGAPTKEGAWDGSLNRPLVGEKGMLTDGGVRVPFVAAWPGTIPAGLTFEHPVIALDVAATAAAQAGLAADSSLDGVDLLPFLTGERPGAPHTVLYWRWRSQAAVLEYPWKLIQLGANERFLFDVTLPDGETKNRLADQPETAARLDAKLTAWSKTLMPAGLPTAVAPEDARFFADHIDKRFAALAPRAGGRPSAAGAAQGWICRNGHLSVEKGRLVITPEAAGAAKERAFIANPTLDLDGPVTVSLRVGSGGAGQGSISWRTRGQADFPPSQSVMFAWPDGQEAGEVVVRLPVAGRLIHLRLTPPRAAGRWQVERLEIQPAKGQPRVWQFVTEPAVTEPADTKPADNPRRARAKTPRGTN